MKTTIKTNSIFKILSCQLKVFILYFLIYSQRKFCKLPYTTKYITLVCFAFLKINKSKLMHYIQNEHIFFLHFNKLKIKCQLLCFTWISNLKKYLLKMYNVIYKCIFVKIQKSNCRYMQRFLCMRHACLHVHVLMV